MLEDDALRALLFPGELGVAMKVPSHRDHPIGDALDTAPDAGEVGATAHAASLPGGRRSVAPLEGVGRSEKGSPIDGVCGWAGEAGALQVPQEQRHAPVDRIAGQ